MTVPPLTQGWQAVRYAVLGCGSLAVLATDIDLAGAWRAFHSAMGRWPHRLAERMKPHVLAKTASAQIFVLEEAVWSPGPRFPLETPFHLLDRFTGGDWLVASSRSERGASNARAVAPDGSVRGRLHLGDGIEQVAIDASDRIWVGWFDEGVFGNEGWQVAGRERSPSSQGIGCFSAESGWSSDVGWPSEVDSPMDCYALNVSGAGAWVCPYTDFPLVRLVPGKPGRSWRTALAGPRAIAVDGDHVLAAGGYAGRANRLSLLALNGTGRGEEAEALATWTLPVRRRSPETTRHVWAEPDLLAGRGDTIHLIDDGVWRRWSVTDLREAGDWT